MEQRVPQWPRVIIMVVWLCEAQRVVTMVVWGQESGDRPKGTRGSTWPVCRMAILASDNSDLPTLAILSSSGKNGCVDHLLTLSTFMLGLRAASLTLTWKMGSCLNRRNFFNKFTSLSLSLSISPDPFTLRSTQHNKKVLNGTFLFDMQNRSWTWQFIEIQA